MKIINNNVYKIMYGEKFLNVGEITDITDKELLKLLLAQPGVEEYVSVDDAKKIEEENKKLKEELEKAKKETKNSKKDK